MYKKLPNINKKLLHNIFLFQNFEEISELSIYSYHEEIIKIDNEDLINKILYGHDHGSSTKNSKYYISTPVAQVIHGLNIYSCSIGKNMIMGLVFDKDDNPYDYKEMFKALLNESLNNEKVCSFEDELEIDNFLITLFIEIRRYGDEIIEKSPELAYYYEDLYQPSLTKVFLFGLDEVGKSSLVRRIKTGEYNDNYFGPTRKFNIEYIHRKTEQDPQEHLLAFWDMPGQRIFRSKWLMGLQDSNVIVYMFDVSNQIRFEESKNEFWKLLNLFELSGVPLIIMGNKIDLLDQSADISEEQLVRLKREIFQRFDFEKIKERKWEFLFTSVKFGHNVESVVELIFDLISL